MTYEQFFSFFSENFFSNLLIICCTFIFIILLQKHRLFSIFDFYLLTYLLPIGFSVSVIIILLIEFHETWGWSLLFSNIVQVCTIAIFIRKKTLMKISIEDKKFFQIFYGIHTIIFIGLFCFKTTKFGLSLFDDKVSFYTGGNGIFVYLELLVYTGQIILILFKEIFYKCKNSKVDRIILFIVFIGTVLGGSKSSIVFFFAKYIFTKYFLLMNFNIYGDNVQRKMLLEHSKRNIILFVCLVPFVLFLFVVVNKNTSYPMIQLLERLVSYGDIYFLAYPTGVIESLPEYSFFQHYFLSLVNPLRRFFSFWNEEPILGFEIINRVYNIVNPTTGPNTRFDVFLQLSVPYFFNLLWSFILGYIYSHIWTSWFSRGKTIIVLYAKIFFMIAAGDIFTDFSFFASCFFSFIFFIPLIYCCSLLIYHAIDIKIIKKINLVPLERKKEY